MSKIEKKKKVGEMILSRCAFIEHRYMRRRISIKILTGNSQYCVICPVNYLNKLSLLMEI